MSAGRKCSVCGPGCQQGCGLSVGRGGVSYRAVCWALAQAGVCQNFGVIARHRVPRVFSFWDTR